MEEQKEIIETLSDHMPYDCAKIVTDYSMINPNKKKTNEQIKTIRRRRFDNATHIHVPFHGTFSCYICKDCYVFRNITSTMFEIISVGLVRLMYCPDCKNTSYV